MCGEMRASSPRGRRKEMDGMGWDGYGSHRRSRHRPDLVEAPLSPEMSSVHPSRAGLVPPPEQPEERGVAANEQGLERERALRERLLRSREDPDGQHTGSRPHNHSPRSQRRTSPSYAAYEHTAAQPPGPPPRRDDYRTHGWNRQTPHHWGPPPPHPDHWDRRSQYNGHAEYPRHGVDEGDGVPPPGAWHRGPRRPDAGSAGGQAYAGGSDFLTSRDEQRRASTLSIWPPSPRSPYRSDAEEDRKRKKRKGHSSSSRKDKHRHSSSSSKHASRHSSSRRHRSREPDTDLSDSEQEREDDRRRRRRHRESDRHKHTSSPHRHRSSRRRDDSDAEDTSDREHSRRRRPRGGSPSSADETSRHKSSPSRSRPDPPATLSAHTVTLQRPGMESASAEAEDDVDDEIGPQLPVNDEGKAVDPRAYGRALLPGEGSAMAAFVQEGQRIPRRGEIGLSTEQIEDYERAGFVMSGSRHRRMNAVRVRKENQVLGAEEQRALLLARREEKEKKEREIVGQLREMLDTYPGAS
ncbi:unnamed protein product [Parajaminaea phylloscopi]